MKEVYEIKIWSMIFMKKKLLIIFGAIIIFALIYATFGSLSSGAIISILTMIAIPLVICFYLLPTIIAIKRNHLQKVPIILINILLGFTAIGWIVALIWACMESKPTNVHIHNEISNNDMSEKLRSLDELRKSGLITDEEYERKKSELLRNY